MYSNDLLVKMEWFPIRMEETETISSNRWVP